MGDLNKIETLRPFRRFCMTIGALPTTYLHSLSYLEMLTWFCEYLEKTVIPTINNNAESVMELQDLFIKLRSFVENYFADLDVQEEINNKLDEMAENGTLQNIIGAFINLNTLLFYNTVPDLKKASNLISGSKCKTLGYYNIKDGGSAYYLIRNKNNYDIIDNSFLIQLDKDNLVAELIIENNTINFKQLGAQCEELSNFSHIDCKPFLDKYINYINNNSNNVIYLYIPSGIWCFSETCINVENINIYGDLQFFNNNTKTNGTIITSLNPIQSYVWKLGDSPNFNYSTPLKTSRHMNINNLTFSSGVYNSNNIPISLNEITRGALYLDNISFSEIPNIHFNYIYGIALGLSTIWEIYFNILNFRAIYNHSKPCIAIDSRHQALGVNSPNISAVEINSIMFEVCNGDYINIAEDCGLDGCTIHHIAAECSYINGYQDSGNITIADDNTIINREESFISGGQCSNLLIESINIQLPGYYVHNLNNINYVRNIIINHNNGDSDNSSYLRIVINNLLYEINKLPIKVINQENNVFINFRNQILINNIFTECYGKNAIPVFELKKYNSLIVNNILAKNNGIFLQNNNLVNNLFFYCFNFVVNNWNSDSKLTSDSDCINPLKIACKSFEGDSNTQILNIPNFVHSKMKIRMKIPSENTAQLFYKNGDVSGSFPSVTGNGVYQWFEFDFSDKNIDSVNSLIISCGNKEVLFDCFYSYD